MKAKQQTINFVREETMRRKRLAYRRGFNRRRS